MTTPKRTSPPLPKIKSLPEILAEAEKTDPAKGITINKRTNTMTLRWEGVVYEIDLAEIKTIPGLLSWMLHLNQKDWVNPSEIGVGRLEAFANAVAEAKGWRIHL